MTFSVSTQVRPTAVTVVTDAHCDRCLAALTPVRGCGDDGGLQLADALVLDLIGGFGMFLDVPELLSGRMAPDPATTKLLCHDCAHSFGAWLGAAVLDLHGCLQPTVVSLAPVRPGPATAWTRDGDDGPDTSWTADDPAPEGNTARALSSAASRGA